MAWLRHFGRVPTSVMAMAIAAAAMFLSCHSENNSPRSSNGASVGTVIALAGTVTATKAENTPRTLTIDSPIFENDTIVTAKAASVTIELTHNNARWEIGEDQSHVVGESIAWRAPQGTGSTLLDDKVDDKNTAAGRHSAHEAAQSGATAADGSASQVASDNTIIRPANPRHQRRSQSQVSPPPPPPILTPEPKSTSPGKSGLEGASLRDNDQRDKEANPKEANRKDSEVKGNRGTIAPTTRITSVIRSCYALAKLDSPGKVTIRVRFNADGKIEIVTGAGSDTFNKVIACAKRKLAGKSVRPNASGKAQATVTF